MATSETPVRVGPAKPDEVILPTWAMPPEVNVHAFLDYQRGEVRRREFRALGLLEKIMFGAAAVYHTSADNPLMCGKQSANLDYYKTGPLVGLSRDEQDVLVCSPMAHPPDLPDPEWRPSYPPTKFHNGIPVPEVPPRVPQRLRDRASGILPAVRGGLWSRMGHWFARKANGESSDFWFVFQPVTQILVLLADRTGLALIECGADRSGRHTALLYNPHRLEGHFVFGVKRVELYRPM